MARVLQFHRVPSYLDHTSGDDTSPMALDKNLKHIIKDPDRKIGVFVVSGRTPPSHNPY